MPDKEPDHGGLSVSIVLECHDTRHHLRLASNTQSAEEEGANPEGDAERQIRREEIDHARVDTFQRVVQARKATRFRDSNITEDGRADDHHAGLSSIGPNGRPDAARITVGHDENKSDEDADNLGPAKHGLEGHTTRHELSGGVNGKEDHGKDTCQFCLGRTACL